MEDARAILSHVKSLEEKYNVLYVNTPWHAMDESTLSKFPASGITPDDAACFMWVDSYTVNKATKLLDAWGFSFHSVYQVLDLAKHPWMGTDSGSTADVGAGKVEAKSGEAVGEAVVKSEPGGAADEGGAGDKDKAKAGGDETESAADKPKRKVSRKPRAPPISPPHWWTTPATEVTTPSRPTTEQLWLAVKGDPSKLFTGSSLAFNVVNLPNLGKKSRSKKIGNHDKWSTERPGEFLEGIKRHLTPEAKVLNVFASSVHATTDCWGPGVPGGYLTSLKANAGIVGATNKVLRSLKKVQLHELCTKLAKILGKDEGLSLTDVSTWPQIEEAVSSMTPNPGYDFKDDDGHTKEWVVRLVHYLSHDNMTNFSILHSKKKRRASAAAGGDRPRHGIASKSPVSKELGEFLGLEEGETIARTQVVSLINKYITANNLKDPVNKSTLLLDDKLKALLSPPDDFGVVTFFNIGKLLKPHLPKSKKEEKGKRKAVSEAGEGNAPVKKACK